MKLKNGHKVGSLIHDAPGKVFVLHPTGHVRDDLLDGCAIKRSTFDTGAHVREFQRTCVYHLVIPT